MKGQTLLEALIALSAVALILSGLTVTIATSLSNATYGKNQAIATQYAQEGVDVVKRIRNVSYSGFQTYSGDYCLAKNATSLQPSNACTGANVDNFKRTVNIEQSGCGINIAKTTVKVAWDDAKCAATRFCHKSQLESCLSTVNPIQAP